MVVYYRYSKGTEENEMKYDRSDIMKKAHVLRKKYGMSMSSALKYAWTRTKLSNALKTMNSVNVRVHYSVYKESFLPSIRGTYDQDTKTIEVAVKEYLLLNAKLYMISEAIPQAADKLNKKVEIDLCGKIGMNWRKICA